MGLGYDQSGSKSTWVPWNSRLVVVPDLAHGEDLLPDDGPAVPVVGTVVLHFLAVPAGADADDGATVRDRVQGRDFLGQRDGIALDHEADPGAQTYSFSGGRGRAEGNERIVGAPIHLGQFATTRKRGRATGRYVGVFREEQAVQAALLDGPGDLDRADSGVGGEHGYPELGVLESTEGHWLLLLHLLHNVLITCA